MITPEGKRLEQTEAELQRAIATLKMREREWAETQAYDEDYARGKP
jgi:hypothetical protein